MSMKACRMAKMRKHDKNTTTTGVQDTLVDMTRYYDKKNVKKKENMF